MLRAIRRRLCSPRLLGLVTAVLCLAVLGSPQPAGATILWSKGGEIWAMADDASGARLLIPLSATPGMNSLRNPGVDPAGSTVFFEGSTLANRITNTGLCGTFPYQYSCSTTHFGFFGTGIYRWAGGQPERLSPPPAYCYNCSSGPSSPAPRADGTLITTFSHCQGFLATSSYTCESAINASSGQTYPSCTDVAAATPNPAAASQVAHTGCLSDGNDALVVTGPDRAGEHVVGCDDGEQSGPAWSPDGLRIAVVEGGTDPGLWVYGAANTACFSGELRRAVATEAGVTLWSPTFVGSSRIVFEAHSELWSVAADCNGCAFPAAATQLTTGGNNSDPVWTSAALNATTPGPAPGGGTPPGQTPAADVRAPKLDASKTATTQRVGAKRRLSLTVSASEAATLTVAGTIQVSGKDPAIGPVTATLLAGSRTTVKVKLGTTAMKALKRAWAKGKRPVAKLQLTLRDAAGNAATAKHQVKLRR